jgi:hypothetical protein
MKNVFKVFGVLMLSALVMTSCKKYDEGGTKGRADKNIKKSWKIDSYYFDGVDSTSALSISNFVETFNDDGTYSRSFINSVSDTIDQTGTWAFDSEKTSIIITGAGSFELTGQSIDSASNYSILKLKKDELWYNFTNEGNTHELRLIPN